MKKILSVFAMMAVASAAFAQGQINFSTGSGSIKVSVPTAADAPVNVGAGAGFVQVLWAPAGTAMTAWSASGNQNLAAWLTANPGWSLAKDANNTADFVKATASGRILSSTITVGTTAAVDLLLIGWTGTSTSFDAAYALSASPSQVAVGFSSKVAGIVPTTAPSPPAVTSFSSLLMTPTAVPEPSTFALAGLGAAALLIFRRRK